MRNAASWIGAAALLTAVLCGHSSVNVAAQETQRAKPLSRIERLDQWLVAVRQHEPGMLDDAAMEIAQWSPDELRTVWWDVSSLVSLVREPNVLTFYMPPERQFPVPQQRLTTVQRESTLRSAGRQIFYSASELRRLREIAKPLDPNAGLENGILKRGAMFHADIAMFAPVASRRSGGDGSLRRYVIRMDDGRQVGLETGGSHWEIGRRLLERVRVRDRSSGKSGGPESDATVRSWYVATTAFMQAQGTIDPLHFFRSLELFPRDADVLFFNAAVHEVLSGPRRQEALRRANVPAGVSFYVGSEGNELAEAEKLYRRTLEIDPDRVEARIRLARVLGRRGNHAEAVAVLQQVAAVDEPVLAYYAALFLGGELEALGKEDEARRAYALAVSVSPKAQSPRLGLTRLGTAKERQAAILAMLALAAEPADAEERGDPWWIYEIVQARDADARLNRLHDAIRNEPSKW